MEPTNRSGPLYFVGPWSRTSRDAASSAHCARETRDKKEQNAPENHDHVGRRPVRRNAPPSAPSRNLRPTLLQHEWLHQLSHHRPGQRNRSLRDLRVHPPTSLTAGASAPPQGPAGIGSPTPAGHGPGCSDIARRWKSAVLGNNPIPDSGIGLRRGTTVSPRGVRFRTTRQSRGSGLGHRQLPAGASSADGDLSHPND
jgi:hypothetical protein